MVGEVLNVSRSGALIRTPYEQQPGVEWPLAIEFNDAEVQVMARVVRCEPARALIPLARQEFAVAVVFVEPSGQAEALLDKICSEAGRLHPRARRLCVSFVRRCPDCSSRAVFKETRYRYRCTGCGQHFSGIRVGIVRFAR
jgi:DNA-directed RNA polymerase subunit RPC12/RpoP